MALAIILAIARCSARRALPSALLYCAGLLAGLLIRSAGTVHGGLAAFAIVVTTCAAIGYAVGRGRS